MINSPMRDSNTTTNEHNPAGPSRNVSFSSYPNSASPLANANRRIPIAGGASHVGGSRPTSGPLMVESILEEEALARKGESGIHLEVVYRFLMNPAAILVLG
jgi:hypothetical protein